MTKHKLPFSETEFHTHVTPRRKHWLYRIWQRFLFKDDIEHEEVSDCCEAPIEPDRQFCSECKEGCDVKHI